jgi:hypothetical protein
MLCEKLQSALIEAAITGADLPPAARAHTESCAHCAAELAQQRSLIARVEANLHSQMNSPVPAAMFQRLEARLGQERQSLPSRSFKFPWLYAAACATVAAMILFALPHQHTSKPGTPVAQSRTAPLRTSPSTTDYRPQMSSNSMKSTIQVETRRTKHHARAVAPSQPEILVPPDEQVALERFIARGNARREFVAAFATSVHPSVDPSFKNLEIPELNTAEIIIQPIATEARR